MKDSLFDSFRVHILDHVKLVADKNANLITIFWNFSTFQYRPFPQMQQNLISNEINFVNEWLYKIPNSSRLRILEIRKY